MPRLQCSRLIIHRSCSLSCTLLLSRPCFAACTKRKALKDYCASSMREKKPPRPQCFRAKAAAELFVQYMHTFVFSPELLFGSPVLEGKLHEIFRRSLKQDSCMKEKKRWHCKLHGSGARQADLVDHIMAVQIASQSKLMFGHSHALPSR